MSARVRITEAGGRVVTGAVRGCGGMVGDGVPREKSVAEAVRRVQGAIDAANEGLDFLGFPARPGFAVLHPEHGPLGDGPAVEVDLRGAQVGGAR